MTLTSVLVSHQYLLYKQNLKTELTFTDVHQVIQHQMEGHLQLIVRIVQKGVWTLFMVLS
jgi:hypothetical protein